MAKLRYPNLSLTIVRLRKILDAIKTPSYKLAKFLVPILSLLDINEYTVKDSKTDCNYVMASFDIESLFTNLNFEEMTENFFNDLFFAKSKIDNLTKQESCTWLIVSCSKRIFFLF